MKQTKIVAGFPGIGKSQFYKKAKHMGLTVLDSDSSKFSWELDDNGHKIIKDGKPVRNKLFPLNYIHHITSNIGVVDIILVSSHDVVRKALSDNFIIYNLVYPSLDCKATYLRNYKERGNDESFINILDIQWKEWLSSINEEKFPYLVELPQGTYLSDVIDKLK